MGRGRGGGGRSGRGRGGGGVGTQGGAEGFPRLQDGYTYGENITANRANFQIGDIVQSPSDARRSGATGRIVSVRRSMVTIEVPYYGGRMLNIDLRIDELGGGFRSRGNTVSRIQ